MDFALPDAQNCIVLCTKLHCLIHKSALRCAQIENEAGEYRSRFVAFCRTAIS